MKKNYPFDNRNIIAFRFLPRLPYGPIHFLYPYNNDLYIPNADPNINTPDGKPMVIASPEYINHLHNCSVVAISQYHLQQTQRLSHAYIRDFSTFQKVNKKLQILAVSLIEELQRLNEQYPKNKLISNKKLDSHLNTLSQLKEIAESVGCLTGKSFI
jgi:hypothetical protein